MRVLVLASDAYGGHGGIALYTRDLIRALVEMPAVSEVVVVPRVVVMPPGAVPVKVRFVAAAAGSKGRYLLHAFRAGWGDYDLVICGHIHLLPLAVLLNLRIRARLALMVYGIEAWRQPGPWARLWLDAVDAIWSISAFTRDRMNGWAKQAETRYCLLPNAAHLESYGAAAGRQDLLQHYGLQHSKVILTLARLSAAERYKGVDEVIELMPSLLRQQTELKYVVAGDGDDRPRLEQKAKALGLGDKVVFTGPVEERDKADYLRLADAFVMPGSGEGFGFVYLEALACGVPVVGSVADGSREALRDGMLGELVDPADPASIEQGILRALAKPGGIPPGIEYFAWPQFCARVSRSVAALLQPAGGT